MSTTTFILDHNDEAMKIAVIPNHNDSIEDEFLEAANMWIPVRLFVGFAKAEWFPELSG
jgi:hypothetical protein